MSPPPALPPPATPSPPPPRDLHCLSECLSPYHDNMLGFVYVFKLKTSCNFLWGWIWNKMKNLVEVHRCSAVISHGSSADVPRSLGLLLDGMILMFWRLNGREIWTCLRHLDSTNSQDVPAYNHLSIHQTSDNDRLQSGLPVCYSKYLNMGKTIISPEYIFQNSVKKYSDRPQTVRLQQHGQICILISPTVEAGLCTGVKDIIQNAKKKR